MNALLCVAGHAAPEASELCRFESTETHMGTAFTIVLYASDPTTANRAFHAAFARIGQLYDALSDYSPDSEVSQLSRSAPHPRAVAVSSDLWKVLHHAQRLSRETEGAFDVTVGPLTRLWRRARRRHAMPASDRLQQALDSVGYQKVKLDPTTKTVRLLGREMRLDVGGIAKGYALDEAIRSIEKLGVRRALVNGGGDIVVGAPPPGESGWQVKLAGMRPTTESTQAILVRNAAVATSGDAWQFVELDGTRYSHLIDPKSGLGLTVRSTVSVIAPTGIEADSLASAVSVLGPERGLRLIDKRLDAYARIILAADSGPRELFSEGFETQLRAED